MPIATPHIISEILNRPLLVTPDKLHAVMQVINNKNAGHLDLDLAALAPYLGADKNGGAVKAEARGVRIGEEADERRVAVIPIIGSTIPRNYGFSDASGLRSYRTISHELDVIEADDTVVGVVLDIDSFGGAAAGCARMARRIQDFAAVKPIYANVDLNCFSALTWLASACTRVYLADEDAGMGSVGCIAIHRDVSGKNAKEGEVYTAVYFGSRKNDYSPHQPLDDDLKKKLLASVTKTGTVFAETVARNRRVSLDDVLSWEAGCFYGHDAIKVGLADGIASFSETIAMVAEDAEKRSGQTGLFTQHGGQEKTAADNGGTTMNIKEQLQALLQEDGATAALAELGYISAEDASGKTERALTAQREEFAAAVDMALISDLTVAQVKPIITGEDLSATTVSAEMQKVKAQAGQKHIASTITPTTRDGKNHLIAAAEKLAGIQ